jgi:hypothetical protein
MKVSEALRLVGQTTFREFTQTDWYSFAGCETDNPLIGENGDWLIILDGNDIEMQFYGEGEENVFTFEVK